MIIEYIGNGSSGNCTYVEDKGTSILIDNGLSLKKIPHVINGAMVLTHEHKDHCSGVDRYMRKYQMKSGISTIVDTSFFSKGKVEEKFITKIDFRLGVFTVKNMEILPCGLWHDTPAFYFIINNKYLHLTDTGALPPTVLYHIKNKPIDLLYLETNYDEELIDSCEYDTFLKVRIKSRIGHLSNQKVMKFLSENQIDLIKIKKIALGHISENTNSLEKINSLISELPSEIREKVVIATEGTKIEL